MQPVSSIGAARDIGGRVSTLSFRFFATFRCPSLRACRNLAVWRTVWMLTVLEVLVVEVAIWMVISMLLRSKLVHLLGTSSKLIWAAIPSHGHYLLLVGFTR